MGLDVNSYWLVRCFNIIDGLFSQIMVGDFFTGNIFNYLILSLDALFIIARTRRQWNTASITTVVPNRYSVIVLALKKIKKNRNFSVLSFRYIDNDYLRRVDDVDVLRCHFRPDRNIITITLSGARPINFYARPHGKQLVDIRPLTFQRHY